MIQKKFATILVLVATIALVLAGPTAQRSSFALAAREPEIYERAVTFDDTSLQTREADDAMDFVRRSLDGALDFERREEMELEERGFDDDLELEERELEDAEELNAREPFLFFDKIKNFFQGKNKKEDKEDDS